MPAAASSLPSVKGCATMATIATRKRAAVICANQRVWMRSPIRAAIRLTEPTNWSGDREYEYRSLIRSWRRKGSHRLRICRRAATCASSGVKLARQGAAARCWLCRDTILSHGHREDQSAHRERPDARGRGAEQARGPHHRGARRRPAQREVRPLAHPQRPRLRRQHHGPRARLRAQPRPGPGRHRSGESAPAAIEPDPPQLDASSPMTQTPYEDLCLYIDGQFLKGGGRKEQDVVNPATDE